MIKHIARVQLSAVASHASESRTINLTFSTNLVGFGERRVQVFAIISILCMNF